jgi:hypothetical protein
MGECAFVELPAEAGAPGKCGRLKRWLYGMRPAASAWEDDYAKNLEEDGFVRGMAAPTAFYNPGTGTRCVVHGDDFTFLGRDADLRRMSKRMAEWYEVKVRALLGPEAGDDKEITILNRTVRWKTNEIEYEADRKHAVKIWESVGLKADSRGLDGPIVKEELGGEHDEGDDELDEQEMTRFRGLAATANFLAQDRPDIQYAAKEICRDMSRPTAASLRKLKRLSRFLVKYPRLVWRFGAADEEDVNYVDAWTDSDWAGCLGTRKSTSGGAVGICGGTLKTWSSTQGTIALSSGEAEYYALVKASAEALGVQSIAKDLGWEFKVRIWIDSSAAKSMASRIGMGRVRHLEVRFLWVQEAVKKRRLVLRKILGTINPADILTKPKTAKEIAEQVERLGGILVPSTLCIENKKILKNYGKSSGDQRMTSVAEYTVQKK